MTSILFFGGWQPPLDVCAAPRWIPGFFWFVLKIVFVFFMFAMVKAIVPRYRYDQLMRLGWKVFLPMSLVMVVLVAAGACFAIRHGLRHRHERIASAPSRALFLMDFARRSSWRCATSSRPRRR